MLRQRSLFHQGNLIGGKGCVFGLITYNQTGVLTEKRLIADENGRQVEAKCRYVRTFGTRPVNSLIRLEDQLYMDLRRGRIYLGQVNYCLIGAQGT